MIVYYEMLTVVYNDTCICYYLLKNCFEISNTNKTILRLNLHSFLGTAVHSYADYRNFSERKAFLQIIGKQNEKHIEDELTCKDVCIHVLSLLCSTINTLVYWKQKLLMILNILLSMDNYIKHRELGRLE